MSRESPSIARSFAEDGAALVSLARAAADACSFAAIERAFRARFGRLSRSPIYGFYALAPDRPQIEHDVSVNVSELFVGRYVRAMDRDPLLAHARRTGRAVYNLGLMSEAEWAETEIYRDAYSMHGLRRVVEVPITDGPR